MIQKLFSVFDSKAEAFLNPFYCPTSGLAIRSFEQAANEEGHQFHMHAGDYTLFELGEWNADSGQTTNHKAPINHGLAITFINNNSELTPLRGVIAGGE